MVSRDRGVKFEESSINVFKIDFNTYLDTGKPHWFNSESKTGVSDHFPFVAEIIIN